MRFITLLFLTFLFTALSSLSAQQIQFDLDNPIFVEPEQIGDICTLDPTDINQHFYIPVDRIRQKVPQMQSAATIQINYINNCGGEAWPQEARDAMEFAMSIWEEHISSTVPIRINASWVALDGNVLGSAGATAYFLSDEGLPNVGYTISQASAMSGIDLVAQEPGVDADIVVNMNCNFADWYYGTDANTPGGLIDFVTVALHEIGHGIGFLGTVNANNNAQVASSGFNNGQIPYIYEMFAVDGFFDNMSDRDIFPNGSNQLYNFVTGQNNGVFFDGAEAELANAADERVRIFAPSQFQPGSSFSHLDLSTFTNTENALMRPQIDRAFAVHNPGPVFCGLLDDMGWPLGPSCEAQLADETIPRKPVLTGPVNNESDMPEENITFSWNETNNAVEYQLQIADNFSFSGSLYDELHSVTEATPALIYEKSSTYYWRVRGLDNDGNGSWSNTWSFDTLEDVPDQVALSAPADGESNLMPGNFSFSWQAANRANSYELQVSEDAGFSAPAIDLSTSTRSISQTGSLEFMTDYFWRVRAVNDQGPGDWSDTRTFTTIIERPDMVSLTSPEKDAGQVSISPVFSWEDAARASEYTIQLSADEDFSELIFEEEISEALFAFAESLDNATIYYWRVRASNIGGTGDWSETWAFATEVSEVFVFNNYPNPFNHSTTLRYQLPEQRPVVISIYDVTGRRVLSVLNEEQEAGVYFQEIDAQRLASGTYLVRFTAGSFSDVQKMTLIK